MLSCKAAAQHHRSFKVQHSIYTPFQYSIGMEWFLLQNYNGITDKGGGGSYWWYKTFGGILVQLVIRKVSHTKAYFVATIRRVVVVWVISSMFQKYVQVLNESGRIKDCGSPVQFSMSKESWKC
jgi:hypothetical protein